MSKIIYVSWRSTNNWAIRIQFPICVPSAKCQSTLTLFHFYRTQIDSTQWKDFLKPELFKKKQAFLSSPPVPQCGVSVVFSVVLCCGGSRLVVSGGTCSGRCRWRWTPACTAAWRRCRRTPPGAGSPPGMAGRTAPASDPAGKIRRGHYIELTQTPIIWTGITIYTDMTSPA